MEIEIKELTLEEVKKEELIMLKETINFCKKHNIRYFLAGGTLLGAIRHKGYIPWDDDIDIMMPREDFEKFQRIAKENNCYLNDNLKVISLGLGNSNRGYIKIINPKIETDYRARSKEERFLWIDIFAIDGLPDEPKKQKRHIEKARDLRRILMLLIENKKYEIKGLRNLCRHILKQIIRYVLKNRAINIARKIENLAKKYDYNSSKYVGVVGYGYGQKEAMLRSEQKDLEVEFEGMKLNGISGYDTYLTNLYDDYMQLPPEEERKKHINKVIKIIEE